MPAAARRLLLIGATRDRAKRMLLPALCYLVILAYGVYARRPLGR